MAHNTDQFYTRLDRIQSARRNRNGHMGFIVHADGIVTPIGRSSSRLRFGFPAKGFFLALMAAVVVKSYLIWFLGIDVYSLQVTSLLSGTSFEQAAGMILMPDALSLWISQGYDVAFAFIQAGIAGIQA